MNVLLRSFLTRIIHQGNLTVIDHQGHHHLFGDGQGSPLVIRFNSAAAERSTAIDPTLKLGEGFMEGDIDVLKGSIYDVLMLAHENTGTRPAEALWMIALEKLREAGRRLQQWNTHSRSRGNVRRHYDLSGDLYRLFLDADAQYSCAYYTGPDADCGPDSLAQAQLAKKRHIAAKMLMQDGQQVLDIGCGWGGMGLYLAQVCQAEVQGVTLSDEQLAVARRRATEAGLADRTRFVLQDYRDIDRRFDRIVSVGMFEHVGVNHYDRFFRKSAQLLRPDGVMVLHTIGRSHPPTATNPFFRRYIFPGGYIPALSEVTRAAEKSGLIITDVEVLRLHYAQTLRAWRKAFMAQRDKARALYDEAFCRMWEFYLAGSEASFRLGGMVVFQIQLTHRNDVLPLTRDYIAQAETALKELESARGIPGPAWPDSASQQGESRPGPRHRPLDHPLNGRQHRPATRAQVQGRP